MEEKLDGNVEEVASAPVRCLQIEQHRLHRLRRGEGQRYRRFGARAAAARSVAAGGPGRGRRTMPPSRTHRGRQRGFDSRASRTGVGARSVGTRRQWLLDALGGVTIDLLGEIETVGTAPLQTLLGPYGEVRLMPVEELLVERVFMAFVCEPPDASALSAAKQLAAVCLAGGVRADWRCIERLAAGKEYGIAPAVRRLKLQVQRELRKKN